MTPTPTHASRRTMGRARRGPKRSGERRGGEEGRARGWPDPLKKKKKMREAGYVPAWREGGVAGRWIERACYVGRRGSGQQVVRFNRECQHVYRVALDMQIRRREQ